MVARDGIEPPTRGFCSPRDMRERRYYQYFSGQSTRLMHHCAQPRTTDPRKIHAGKNRF